MPRTSLTLAAAAALTAGLLPAVLGAGPSSAAEPVRLLSGTTPATSPFPSDAFTVADAGQQTGRRVALPTAGCDALGRSLCDDLRLINLLDGFDLQPRVTLPFSGDVDLASVSADNVFVEGPAGVKIPLVQLVLDPATDTVSGLTADLLAERTTYTLVVTNGVKAADGTAVDVGGAARRVPFTTMTASNVLDKVRAALDDGTAYAAAGIAEVDRGLAFDAVPGLPRSVFDAPAVLSVDRQDQTSADPSAPRTTQQALISAKSARFLGFGSLRSPQYTDGNGVIAPLATRGAPSPRSAAQIGVTMMAGTPGASCLRPIVFGPGFTRSKYDLFLSADTLPGRGTALFATDPLGHSFGPESTFSVRTANSTLTGGKGFGRGKDLDGDGLISNSEGVGPTFRVARTGTGGFTPVSPSPDAATGLRDGLIQTVVDNMVLVRALEKGVDVDGNGSLDTCTGVGAVSYFGQSFGGIYGTMLLGTDTHLTVGVPNVPGGPIVDIARLSAFRGNIAAVLQANDPNRLNGGKGLNGFTESLPLRLDPRVADPVTGAIAVQELGARSNWVSRAGSPETYAARMAAKKVIVQVAYADGTVPNPTSATLLRAGNLFDRAWIYRNDRTPTFQTNPHGFLLDPTVAGRNQAQAQIQDFLLSDGATQTDPDGPGPVWERNAALYAVQLNCLHYADPQTGVGQSRTPNAADCVDASANVATPTATTSPEPRPTGSRPPVGVSVAPKIITIGQSARVEATAGPGATVELLAYSRPNTTYAVVRSGTADDQGRIAWDVRPGGNTRLMARSIGVESPSVVLMVRTSVNLRVARTGTRAYRFSGAVLPKRAGETVSVFYERGSGRVLAGRVKVAADGTYALDRTFGGTGSLVFFAQTGGGNNNAVGTSNRVRVQVR